MLAVVMVFALAGPVATAYFVPSLVPPEALPEALAWPATALVDDRIWVLGGQKTWGRGADTILSIDPAGGAWEVHAATLPAGIHSAASAVDPVTGDIYIIGGSVYGDPWWSDRIIRFEPDTHTVTTMETRLSHRLVHAAAAWIDNEIYLFGGDVGGSYSDKILAYDPFGDELRDTGDRLPFSRMAAAAAGAGSFAWVFGGYDSAVGYTGQVVRYTPSTGEVRFNWEAPLPSPRGYAAAVWDGKTAWVLGGVGNDGETDEVVGFTLTPTNNYIGQDLAATLPSPRFGTGAATGYVPEPVNGVGVPRLYVLGGYSMAERWIDEVVDYNLLIQDGPEE